jgi:hypothetical protein
MIDDASPIGSSVDKTVNFLRGTVTSDFFGEKLRLPQIKITAKCSQHKCSGVHDIVSNRKPNHETFSL